ncbi:SPOR domain-containing protein [Gracilimonas sp. Q87]|uniref:SPOR domain-containing protein n=1 Tax=Gracilimonas sp. Q87 TaxID=3384766 RepID=UPI0039843E8D
MKRSLIIFPLLVLIVYGCSTTEQTVEEAMDEIERNYSSSEEFEMLRLETLRTTLADSYSNKKNEIPEVFNQTKIQREVEKNIYEGYRIQIFSGEDVVGADTTAGNFRAWADTTIAGYQPKTYVFFKTPYYRVHVGDFHERDKAIQFSNIVKRYFKDAWVVYDNVDPGNVPTDSTTIELIRREDR